MMVCSYHELVSWFLTCDSCGLLVESCHSYRTCVTHWLSKFCLLYFLLIVGSLYQEFLDQLLMTLSSNPCKLYGFEL